MNCESRDYKEKLRLQIETTYSKARRDLFPDLPGLADDLFRRGPSVLPDVEPEKVD
jgi:hypothetical protein